METTKLEQLEQYFPGIKNNAGYQELLTITTGLTQRGYAGLFRFDPSLIRGFDYYDGMVFEVFDKHPDNNRAMFGGGRYNGLAAIFGVEDIPAVGFAPGDEATKLFLESWGLLEKFKNPTKDCYFIPVLDESLAEDYAKINTYLREK